MSTIQNEAGDVIKDVKNSLQQNRELLEKVYDLTYKVKRYLFWNQMFSIAKIALLAITLIAFAVYFLPLFKDVMTLYTGNMFE